MDNILKLLGMILLATIGVVGACLLNAWVLTRLWAWFLVPIFHLPGLGLAGATGVSVVITLLTHQSTPAGPKKSVGQLTGEVIATPLTLLLIGYVAHLFLR